MATASRASHSFNILRAMDRVAELQRAETMDEAVRVYEQIIAGFGATMFSAGIIENPAARSGPPVFIATWPEEWQKRWYEQNHRLVDPIVRENLKSVDPFCWEDVFERTDEHGRKVFYEGRTFGLHDGFTVPSRNADYTVSTVTVVGEKLDWSDSDRSCVHLVSLYFVGVMRKFLAADRERRDVSLTPREREILHWMAAGKENPAISEILTISENSVKFHVKNILRKMNCTTRAQAAVEAIRCREIAP